VAALIGATYCYLRYTKRKAQNKIVASDLTWASRLSTGGSSMPGMGSNETMGSDETHDPGANQASVHGTGEPVLPATGPDESDVILSDFISSDFTSSDVISPNPSTARSTKPKLGRDETRGPVQGACESNMYCAAEIRQTATSPQMGSNEALTRTTGYVAWDEHAPKRSDCLSKTEMSNISDEVSNISDEVSNISDPGFLLSMTTGERPGRHLNVESKDKIKELLANLSSTSSISEVQQTQREKDLIADHLNADTRHHSKQNVRCNWANFQQYNGI